VLRVVSPTLGAATACGRCDIDRDPPRRGRSELPEPGSGARALANPLLRYDVRTR